VLLSWHSQEILLVDVVSHTVEPAQMGKQNLAAAPKPSFVTSLHDKDRKHCTNQQHCTKCEREICRICALACFCIKTGGILVSLPVINDTTAWWHSKKRTTIALADAEQIVQARGQQMQQTACTWGACVSPPEWNQGWEIEQGWSWGCQDHQLDLALPHPA